MSHLQGIELVDFDKIPVTVCFHNGTDAIERANKQLRKLCGETRQKYLYYLDE